MVAVSDCRACDRFIQSTWTYCPHCGVDQDAPVDAEADGHGDADAEVATDGGTADLPPPKDGADPWCTWCEDDLEDADAIWMIEGHDDSRWPAAFCSEHCAREWGCSACQERVFRVDDPSEVLAR